MKLLKKNNKPVTQENQYLLQEIALTKRALSAAYSNFDNATDPDLIDCYIYQVNSEQKRYKYLLQKSKKNMKKSSAKDCSYRRCMMYCMGIIHHFNLFVNTYSYIFRVYYNHRNFVH